MMFEDLTERIIGCSIEVHRELGPGLLESVYKAALGVEFSSHGISFEAERQLPVVYKSKSIGLFRMDLVVDDTVVVELKSCERHDPVFEAQLLSYMKLGGYKIGSILTRSC